MKLKLVALLWLCVWMVTLGPMISVVDASHKSTSGLGPVFGRDLDHTYYDNYEWTWSQAVEGGTAQHSRPFTWSPDAPYSGISQNHSTQPLTIDMFISEHWKRLNSSADYDRARAAGIINMMLGYDGNSPAYNGPHSERWRNGVEVALSEFSRWESIVRAYDDAWQSGLGWGVEFNDLFSEVNPRYWLGTAIIDPGGATTQLPELVNVQLWDTFDMEPAVIFYNPDGTVFNLLKKGNNVTGDVSPLQSPGFVPLVTSSQNIAAPGESFSFTFGVKNNSSVPGTTEYEWRVRPDSGIDLQSSSGTSPTIGPGPAHTLATSNTFTAAASMGGKVCATLDLKNGSSPAQACVSIGKKPLFQVWNGDAWAGGRFDNGSGDCSAQSGSPGNIKGASSSSAGGSWSEYGVFSLGEVKDFGSAAQPRFSGQLATKLMFSNSDVSNPSFFHGNPTSTAGHCLTNFFNHFSIGTPVTALPSLINPSVNAYYKVSGDAVVNVNSGGIGSGSRVIIHATGNVTIATNIVYQNNAASNIQNLALVVILADGDIKVNDNVTQIDAWLSAKGTLDTCANQTVPLSTAVCSGQLVFNGPVVVDEVSLKRTHGAGTGERNRPAEKFNMRPDVYIRGYGEKVTRSQVRTVKEQELPPRY